MSRREFRKLKSFDKTTDRTLYIFRLVKKVGAVPTRYHDNKELETRYKTI